MTTALRLPDDFDSYAWEVEAKGVFWDAIVSNSGQEVRVTFYDPVRLAQDVDEEMRSHRVFSASKLVVVERVTREYMMAAVEALHRELFD